MPSMTVTTDRARRVDQARNVAVLPRKPLPMLLLLIKLYVDGDDCRALLAYGPDVSPAEAAGALRTRLDEAEPQDFAEVVRVWTRDHRATWRD